jgi:lysophospholipase L1-like esterase
VTRRPFPQDRTVYVPSGGLWRTGRAGAVVALYVDADPAGPPAAVSPADFRRADGTVGPVLVDSNSQMQEWLGSDDNADSMIVRIDGGVAWRVYARQDDRLDALDVRVAALEPGGSSAAQPADADLTTIAGLAPTDGDVIQRTSGAWANRTPTQVKTSLSLVKADVGLGSADNTPDTGKPVSTAQQAALDGKASTTHASTHASAGSDVVTPGAIGAATSGHNHTGTYSAVGHGHAEADVTSLVADIAAKAPTTRTITAGTGLTGGGDLTADRTLAVSYGTSSTTATAGNDPRLIGPAGQLLPFLHKLRTNQPVTVMIAGSSSIGGYLQPTGTNTVEAPTAGNYQAQPEGAGRQMWTQLATRYGNTNTTVINAAVAGTTAREWIDGGGQTHVSALRQALIEANPDAVVIGLNSNDANVPWSQTAAQFEVLMVSLYREALRHGCAVLAVPSLTHYAVTGTDYANYPAACYRAASRVGIPVVPIESTLQGPSPGTALAGMTFDSLHPTVAGAAALGAAFAAAMPDPATLHATAGSPPRPPRGDYTDPLRVASIYAWVSAGGADRRHQMFPWSDADGWAAASPPPYLGGGLMLRESVFLSDCIQDAGDTAAIRDLSGHGVDGHLGAVKATTTDHPTWVSGGGLAFAGSQFAVIPLDAAGKRTLVPAINSPMTVRVVVSNVSLTAATFAGRRGDAAAAPFAAFVDAGAGPSSLGIFTRGASQDATLTTTWASGPHDIIITCQQYAGGGGAAALVYDNGVLVATQSIASTVLAADFDWTLGGRWNGTTQAAATPNRQFTGRIHWVDIARCYVRSTEAAALYAPMKAKLNADRALALP